MTRSIQHSVRLGDLFRDEFHWYREQALRFLGNPERPILGRLFKILLSRLKRLESRRLSACDPGQIRDLAKLLSYLPTPQRMTAFGVPVASGMQGDNEAMSYREGLRGDLREKTFNHLKTVPPFDEILAITNPKVRKTRHAPVAVRQLAVLAYDIHLQVPSPGLNWKQIAAILKQDKAAIRNAVRQLKKFLDKL
jgi:hypothetical protein